MIILECPDCGKRLTIPEKYAGTVGKCKGCGGTVEVPTPLPEDHNQPSAHKACAHKPFDSQQRTGMAIAGGGLLLICLSPFFKWASLGAGGVIGLSGDGRILLAVTAIGSVAYLAAVIKRKWLAPLFLAVQAWGVLVVFWMGTLLWEFGSLSDAGDMNDNPFAEMVSTMLISPGAGLYLGLVGGIAVAGALGFVAVRHLLSTGNLRAFYASQCLSCLLGILLAVFIGQHPSAESNDIGGGSLPRSFPGRLSLFSSETQGEEPIDACLGVTFTIGNLEITPKTIQLVTLEESPMIGDAPQPRTCKSYVLTFVARNKSDGQVFSAFSTNSSVVDNFNNVCSDPSDSRDRLFTTYVPIDGNEHLKDIRPGESATVMVAFDPALESAEEYTWTISTKISNKDEHGQWRIRFSQRDIDAQQEPETPPKPSTNPLTIGTAIGEVFRDQPLLEQEEGADVSETDGAEKAYIVLVQILSLEVRQAQQHGFGPAVWGVFGSIKNNGDKTLKTVEITVYFFNTANQVIGEDTLYPVLVTDWGFSDDKPLKAGYVNDFGFSVEDSAPSGWSGYVEARITDIEFMD